MEQLNAWLQNFRRIFTRHEYHAENYLGFVHFQPYQDSTPAVFTRLLLDIPEVSAETHSDYHLTDAGSPMVEGQANGRLPSGRSW